jgi:hypothetical protein
MIEPVKVVAADLKGGNPASRVLDPDSAQVTAFAQEKRPDKDVCGLVVLDGDHLLWLLLIFGRRCGRRRVSSASAVGVFLKPINFPLSPKTGS